MYDDTQVQSLVEAATSSLRDARSMLLSDASSGTLRQSLREYLESCLRPSPIDDELPDSFHRRAAAASRGVDPAIARALVRRRTEQWAASVTELCTRVERDRAQLTDAFGIDHDATLDTLSVPLGDLHNHGRSVYGIRFSDGHTLIYKPRPVDTEAVFGAFLDWLLHEGCPPGLMHCRTLARQGYGWTEFVDRVFCATEEEGVEFYRHQGGQLAILWLLGATDLVGDNVIVHRHQPVWVDNECICTPDLRCASSVREGIPEWIRDSILTTSMLPLGDGAGGAPKHHTGLDVCCFHERSLAYSQSGKLKAPFLQALIRGFEEAYYWMATHRHAWWSTPQWRQLSQLSVRVVLRPTALYSNLVWLLSTTTGEDHRALRQQVADVLRTGQGSRNGVRRWPDDIVEGELRALDRGDVPYWHTSPTSRDLFETDWIVRSAIERTGVECLERRSLRMSDPDLRQQIWLILAFHGEQQE